MTKTCSACAEILPVSNFHKGASRCKECKRASAAAYYSKNADDVRRKAREWHANNKDRAKSRMASWRAKNPTGHRKAYYASTYGITPEDREAQMLRQGCACLLCATNLKEIPDRHVHVDHCHSTGKVRGLLCHWCNTRLGALEADPGWLARARSYLDRGGDWPQAEKSEAA